MSGYRTIYRYRPAKSERNDDDPDAVKKTFAAPPVWSVAFSPCHQSRRRTVPPAAPATAPHRLLLCRAAAADDDEENDDDAIVLRCWSLSLIDDDEKRRSPDAAVLRVTERAPLWDNNASSSLSSLLGTTRVSVVRNHVGEDAATGGEVAAAISLDGQVTLFARDERPAVVADDGTRDDDAPPRSASFVANGATGTTVVLGPPSTSPAFGGTLSVAVGRRDGAVAVHDAGVAVGGTTFDPARVGRLRRRVGGGGGALVTALAWRGDVLAVGRADGTVDAHDARDGTRVARVVRHFPGPVRGLDLTTDGALLLAGGDDGRVDARDVSSSATRSFVAHAGSVTDLRVHPDGRRFATASADGSVRVWALGSDDPLRVLDGRGDDDVDDDDRGNDAPPATVWGLSFSRDGSLLASCGDDGSVRVYSCGDDDGAK